jgi:hypothetical protein
MERYANQQGRHIPSMSGWGNATRAQGEKQQESVIPCDSDSGKVCEARKEARGPWSI